MPGPSLRATSFGSSTTYSCNVTYPTGTVSGDYVVAWVYCGDFDLTPGGTAVIDTPTGWTLLQSEPTAADEVAAAMLGKFCTGETSETFTWDQPTTSFGNQPGIRVQLTSYENVDPTNPVHDSNKSTYSSTSATTVVVPAMATTLSDISITRFAAGWDNTGNTCTWTAGEYFDESTDFGDNFCIQSGTHGVRAAPATPGTGDTCTFSASTARRVGMSVALQPPQLVVKEGTDTGSGSDTATVLANVPAADTGSGADTATVGITPTTDTGSVSETASVTVVETDTGSAVETATIEASVPVADSGSAMDMATVEADVPVTDSGSFVDTATVVVQADDNGAFFDWAIPHAQDSGSATEDASIVLPVSDSGSFVDDAFVSNTVAGSDAGSFADAATVGLPVADSASAVEDANVSAGVPATDSASAVETAQVSLSMITDSGSLTDSASIALPLSDSGSFTDFALVSVGIAATDAGAFADDARVVVHGSDEGIFFDSAARTDEGRLVAPRLYRVPPEGRVIDVAADARTLRVHAEE